MLKQIIVDADFCIKLGGSEKYPFLFEVLPLLASEIYMHNHAYNEVMYPTCAKRQLTDLKSNGIIKLVDQSLLQREDRIIFDMSYASLEKIMIDPRRPNKNKGEVSSLAYAKATGIPIFATDESSLQQIIDVSLNSGINDIRCLRIRNVVEMIKNGEIDLPRKYAKALWRISYNNDTVKNANEIFDKEIWPLSKPNGK